MDVIVRALMKSHVPRPHIGKSGCGLEKWHATYSLILRCLRYTSNRSCLMPYDVIHYNDVRSALGSYVFRRNIRFISVDSF